MAEVRFRQLLSVSASLAPAPIVGGNVSPMAWATLYALDEDGRVWWLGFDDKMAPRWFPIASPSATAAKNTGGEDGHS